MAGHVLEFTDESFKPDVLEASEPVMVDFWAPWCGPCRVLAPTIEKIAEGYQGKVKVGKVNVDENMELATKYDVATIPRVMLFKGTDQPIFLHVGVISEAELSKVINANV